MLPGNRILIAGDQRAPWDEWVLRRRAQEARDGNPYVVRADLSPDFPATAHVSSFLWRGIQWIARWAAICGGPLPGGGSCMNGELVDPGDPRFFCTACGNRCVGGAWRELIVPGAEERESAEAILLARPRAQHRNWIPGVESLLDLATENIRAGDPVPQAIGDALGVTREGAPK